MLDLHVDVILYYQIGSKHIPAVMDIKMSLRERFNRLKSIIKYIDANRIMNKVWIALWSHATTCG